VRELVAGKGPGEHIGQVKHPDAVKRLRHVCARVLNRP
jgi:hypothetical protein